MARVRPKLGASCGLVQDLGWEAGLRWFREAGFEGVEIPVAPLLHPDRTSVADLRRVRDLCADNRLEVIGLHMVYPFEPGYRMLSPEPAERGRSIDFLKRVMDEATVTGGRSITVGSPHARSIPEGMSYEQGWELAVEAFSEWAAHAEPRGLVASLEILNRYETNIGLTMDEGTRLVEAVGSRAVAMTPDTYHANIDEDPLREAILRNVKNIVNFHMGDSNRQAPGRGNFDFHKVIRALVDGGYDRFLSLELMKVYIGVPLRIPLAESLREGREYLSGVIDQVLAE
jgi:sugar phosphate isomerase/epimerase